MKYTIWKASINEYRVQNNFTGEVKVVENFTAVNCEFRVNLNQYESDKLNGFKNSGNPFDYFAWIEAEYIFYVTKELLEKKVFYNPFKCSHFRDRTTNEIITFANEIIVQANTLSYE